MNVASEIEREQNRRIIRSTAMKSFHRKQHLQRTLKAGGMASESIGGVEVWSGLQPVPDTYGQDTLTLSHTGWSADEAVLEPSMPATLPSNITDDTGLELSDSRRHKNGVNLGSPTSWLGAGRVDPFRIAPIDISSRDNELFDHCELVTAAKQLLIESMFLIKCF